MIGDTTWFAGVEYTITTEPYILYGGEFVDGVAADGTVKTMPTDAQMVASADRSKAEFRTAQDGFATLKGV